MAPNAKGEALSYRRACTHARLNEQDNVVILRISCACARDLQKRTPECAREKPRAFGPWEGAKALITSTIYKGLRPLFVEIYY